MWSSQGNNSWSYPIPHLCERYIVHISTTIKLFADDTKVYREIADSINDTRALQTDIDRLATWATLWQLRNPEKSETMRITHNRDKSSPSYTMRVAIKPVKCVKDLGVFISYDLT